MCVWEFFRGHKTLSGSRFQMYLDMSILEVENVQADSRLQSITLIAQGRRTLLGFSIVFRLILGCP